MYGVIIENGPQNWQILQQTNGFATVGLSGRVEVGDVSNDQNQLVIVRAIDENNGTRVTEPVVVNPINNRWSAELTIPVGGPYRIESYLRYERVFEKRGDRIFHVGVGDVYVIAGQSNAVGVGKDFINDPISTDVHMFHVNGNWDVASHPLHDGTNTKFLLSQEKTQTGHSPWLNFAKLLNKELGYPIGLIPATVGGVPLSFWNRAEDGKLFNNMLDIIAAAKSGIKGVIWYQGCNEINDEKTRTTYFERFKNLCADFESTFYKGIPILTVQLNKVTCTKDADIKVVAIRWAELREQQRQAMNLLSNVYMAPSIDLPVCDGIHNSAFSNMVIGQRVANLALKNIYGKSVICEAPNIEKAINEGEGLIRLYFKNVYDRIFCDYNCTDKQMFTATDNMGVLFLTDYECLGDNTISLVFDRCIAPNAKIGCRLYNDTGLMPYDLFSYLPIIPFDNVTVE